MSHICTQFSDDIYRSHSNTLKAFKLCTVLLLVCCMTLLVCGGVNHCGNVTALLELCIKCQMVHNIFTAGPVRLPLSQNCIGHVTMDEVNAVVT